MLVMEEKREKFAGLCIGDAVYLQQGFVGGCAVKVIDFDASIITIVGGKTFHRETGFAEDGGFVFIKELGQ